MRPRGSEQQPSQGSGCSPSVEAEGTAGPLTWAGQLGPDRAAHPVRSAAARQISPQLLRHCKLSGNGDRSSTPTMDELPDERKVAAGGVEQERPQTPTLDEMVQQLEGGASLATDTTPPPTVPRTHLDLTVHAEIPRAMSRRPKPARSPKPARNPMPRRSRDPAAVSAVFDEIMARDRAAHTLPVCRHCQRRFAREDNGPGACHYHPGAYRRPGICYSCLCLCELFNAEPRWSCCGDIDQFAGPCKTSRHMR